KLSLVIVVKCIRYRADKTLIKIIIFMALAEGKSRVRSGPITLHTQTAIHIAELLTKAKFSIEKDETNPNMNIIECEGIGMINEFI
ncbi:hypothetical protein LSTR_LSTR010991, partial [Laodelphax striatellus]